MKGVPQKLRHKLGIMTDAKDYTIAEQPQKEAGVQDVTRMDPERRKQVEKSLKRKLDARCSLFVLIYIMVRSTLRYSHAQQLTMIRITWIETTSVQRVLVVYKRISALIIRNMQHA